MTAQISQTAAVTAYLRAFACVELYDDHRSGDWLAHHFLPPDWAASLRSPEARAHVKAHVMQPGMYAYLTARTAHFDDLFRRAVGEGVAQVVNLGAGYDTRAWRLLPPDSSCRVFELDTPATQQHKRACLESFPAELSPQVVFSALDLRERALDTVFTEIGVAREERTLFILEGLTMYLPCPTVAAVLSAIQEWAAGGSGLVMDYLFEDVLAGETARYGAAGLQAKASDHGEPLRCGHSEAGIEQTARDLGYAVRRHLPPKALSARCLTGVDAQLTGPISECFATIVLALAT